MMKEYKSPQTLKDLLLIKQKGLLSWFEHYTLYAYIKFP